MHLSCTTNSPCVTTTIVSKRCIFHILRLVSVTVSIVKLCVLVAMQNKANTFSMYQQLLLFSFVTDYYIDGTLVKGQYSSTHMDMLHEVDLVVGSLVSAMEERKLTEDTIIIFTSDNGGF